MVLFVLQCRRLVWIVTFQLPLFCRRSWVVPRHLIKRVVPQWLAGFQQLWFSSCVFNSCDVTALLSLGREDIDLLCVQISNGYLLIQRSGLQYEAIRCFQNHQNHLQGFEVGADSYQNNMQLLLAVLWFFLNYHPILSQFN